MTETERVSVEEHIDRLRRILTVALEARETSCLELESDGLAGHICAEHLKSPIALPTFDNSQMDGFAVRSQDVQAHAGDAEAMEVSAVVPAGTAPPALTPGTAAAVMTGAPVPAGADVVIPVEKTADGFTSLNLVNAGKPAQVRFIDLDPHQLQPGRFIRPAGSAVSQGETLVEQGQPLTPARLGLLAACGFHRIPVLEPVRSLVISTGAELRAPGQPLRPGEVYDANTVLICAALENFGHSVTRVRISSDDPQEFIDQLYRQLRLHKPHLVVTAGGVSAGAFEVVREALTHGDVEFAAIAQQPGGPQGWGLLPIPDQESPAAFIGLPGNPVSCAVSIETLLRPALSTLDPGCRGPTYTEVRVGEDMTSPRGVRQFRRVKLSEDKEPRTAHPVGGPGSHLLGHYARADALLVLFEDDQEIASGELRPAMLLA